MNKEQLAVLFVALGGALLVLKSDNELPTGIRNNNPLNIKSAINNDWVGQVGVDSRGFVIFDTPENGFRAAAKTLMTYARKGYSTLESIIARWAPAGGKDNNDTAAYIKDVSQKTGIQPDDYVNVSLYPDLLAAMTYHENGVFPYSMQQVLNGVGRA